MSYSRSFRETLHAKNKELYNRLTEIEKIAKPLLTYTAAKFPYYTPHDFNHSERCEEILCWLTPNELREDMNPHELFFSILACWFHDWGMVGKLDEDPEKIREDHHLRTERNFEEMYSNIRLSRSEARIIGKICRGHRKEDLTDKEYDDMIFGSNILVRVRLLSALVRIADECEVEESRVPEVIYYNINPIDKAKEEFERHLDTIGVGLAAKHKICIEGVARDPKGAQALRMLRDKMQKELDGVKVILSQYGITLDQVELKLDARGFIDRPIGFTLDRKRITQLLIGEHLYSRKDVAIRELLQNSLDACRLRKELEQDYKPEIKIVKTNNILEVCDNGNGMDFDSALSFLANKGHSFYESEEFSKLHAHFEPISRFGLGILSCFLISNKMEIETKRSGEDPCEFIIESVDQGWTYRRGLRDNIGTTIKLTLTEDGKKINVQNILQHYLKVTDIPVTLSIEGKEESFLPIWNEKMSEFLEHMAEYDEPWKVEKIVHVSNDELEFTIYKTPNIYSETVFVCLQGIYVNSFNSDSLSSISTNQSVILLNMKKNIVDLSVSREKIVENQKLKTFKNYFADLLFTSFLKFRGVTGLNKSLSGFLSLFSIFGNDLDVHIDYPIENFDAIPCFCKELINFPVLNFKGLLFVTLQELLNDRKIKKIFWYNLHASDEVACEAQIQLVKNAMNLKILQDTSIVFSPQYLFFENKQQSIPLLKVLCNSKNIEYSGIDIIYLLGQKKYNKINTRLNPLLPKEVAFATRDNVLHSLPLLARFDASTISHPLRMSGHRYTNPIHKIFQKDVILLKSLPETTESSEELELKMFPIFLDPEDIVLKILIEKADVILKDNRLRLLVARYFKALYFMANQSFFWGSGDILQLWLTTMEQDILQTLNAFPSKYEPLNLRTGVLWKPFISAVKEYLTFINF